MAKIRILARTGAIPSCATTRTRPGCSSSRGSDPDGALPQCGIADVGACVAARPAMRIA